MKRTHIRKAASFLAAVLCLTGSVITAGQMPGTVKAAPPRVTFKNEEKAEPYLYVIKDVKSALEGTPVPDNQANVSFTFRLTVEGQPKKNEIFTLYDSRPGEGRQGVSVEESQVTPEDAEINGPWQITRNGIAYTRQQKSSSQALFATDDDGEFTLQAGQMARFYIGRNKSYEVTEVSMPDRFTADADNTSGTIGIMGKSGRYAVITNKWMPDEQPGETTRLEVKKTVVFPDRYQSPESLFAFQLAVFGQNGYEAYAGRTYTVMDANQETPVVIQGVTDEQGRAVTDTDGVFYLKAGSRAVFQEFPAKGYWVKELLEAGDIETVSAPVGTANAQVGSGATVQTDTTGQVQGNSGNTTADGNQENAGSAAPDAAFRAAALTALENDFWRLANGTEQKPERVASAPLALNTFENINAAFMVTKSIKPVAGQDSSKYADKEFTFLLTRGA